MPDSAVPENVGRKRRSARRVENIESLLDVIVGNCGEGSGEVHVRDLLGAVGRRAYGPLLLAVGLFSISPATVVPGLTWLSATLAGLIAIQMALGMKYPWLPKGMLDARVPDKPLLGFVERARPWARRIDRFIRPRFTFLAAPPFVNLIALLCVGAALVTIPLGFVPFAPLLPGFAIVLFGLGMTAKDGLLLMFGVAAVALGVALVTRIAGSLPFF